MIFPSGEWVILECYAETGARLAGKDFALGERIAIKLGRDLETDGVEKHGGAWGWGRYSHRHVYAMAAQIEDLTSCEIIWEAKAQKLSLVPGMLV